MMDAFVILFTKHDSPIDWNFVLLKYFVEKLMFFSDLKLPNFIWYGGS